MKSRVYYQWALIEEHKKDAGRFVSFKNQTHHILSMIREWRRARLIRPFSLEIIYA